MRFAGKVWKLLVGIKDGLVLLFMLLFFALLYAAMTARPTLGAGDRARFCSSSTGRSSSSRPRRPRARCSAAAARANIGFATSSTRFETAAADDRVKAVALDLDIFSGGGQATLSSVGEALDAVRKAGKPVLAYATAYDDDCYLLAAHASEVWLNPMGGVLVTGPGGANLYFKGLLDKLGVTANVYKAGTYKAAVEPFTRTDMSPEAREALTGGLRRDVGELAAGGPPGPAQGAARALYRRPAGADRRGRRRHGAGGAQARAWSTRSASARRSTAGSPRSPASATPRFPEASSESIRRWAEAHPASDSGGEIGIVTIAGDIVDGEADLGTAGARDDRPGAREGAQGARPQGAGGPDRFRRRLGPRLGADPPGGARRQGQGPAGGGVDGQRRRLGRLLGGDGGRPHLRRTLDHHRLDRRVRDPAELRGQRWPSSASAPTASRRRPCRASRTCCAAPRPRPTGCSRWASTAPIAASSPWSRRRARSRSPGSTRSPRAGSGTAAPPTSSRLVDSFGGLDDAVREAAQAGQARPRRGQGGVAREGARASATSF